jgi:hypothetical protein
MRGVAPAAGVLAAVFAAFGGTALARESPRSFASDHEMHFSFARDKVLSECPPPAAK